MPGGPGRGGDPTAALRCPTPARGRERRRDHLGDRLDTRPARSTQARTRLCAGLGHGPPHARPHLLRLARGRRRGARRDARLRRHAQHGHERRPRARRADRPRPRGRLAAPTASSSAASTCPTSATSCTTSAGTPARRALCPWAPHPHVERRYLLVPGLRSSRIHVVDVKDDPRNPKLVKVIEPEEIARKTGYSRPHTDPLRPRRDLRLRARQPRGRRPGRHLPARPRRLLGQGRLGAATAGRRSWPTTSGGTSTTARVITSEWGTPNMVEDGLQPRAAARQQVRPQAARLGPREAHATCRRSTSAPSTRWCSSCGRRTTRARPTASSASSPRPPTCRASVWLWERADGRHVRAPRRSSRSRRAGRGRRSSRRCCSRSAPCRRWSPTSRCRSTTSSLVRLLLGHRRAQALRRLATRATRARPAPCASAASSSARAHPAAGPLNGGPQMVERQPRRQARLPDQLALRRLGRAVLPRGHRRLAGQARRRRGRLADARPRLLRRVQRRAPAPGAPGGRRRVDRLVLLPERLRWTSSGPAILLGLLGAYHGLNPAMGWLFAVALGMQERDRARGAARAAADRDRPRGVDRARGRCSCSGSGVLTDPSALHLGAGVALIAFGLFRFVKPRAHFRWTTDARQPARADVVVVPDVERPRRRADGRAGADRRRRGDRRLGRLGPRDRRGAGAAGSRSRAARWAITLHVGGDAGGDGASWRCWSTTTSASPCCKKAWLNLDAVWAGAFVLAGVLTLFT